ncbi:MAG TPA: DUF711 family protein [Anaerolineaceae bacterium]|nr:DUF711 family protein [Anaerolineaceae bacterium]
MRIRSITYFVNPGWPLQSDCIQNAGRFLAQARDAFSAAGYDVQTVRLATVPFPTLLPALRESDAVELAQTLEGLAVDQGIDYVSMGPALPEYPHSYAMVPGMIAATRSVFLSASLATLGDGQISLRAVHECARIITRNAQLTPDGFSNLRFTAIANAAEGSPFFPVAYHHGEDPRFAIATESADLAVTAFQDAPSLEEARRRLVNLIEDQADGLVQVAEDLAHRLDVDFGGIDFTLAPFPERERSVGAALELLGVPRTGLAGSLAAAAILADTLDQARFPRAGFCGVMYPVLEDSILAERAAEGYLRVNDLLLYSAVCGTGLDTIPLPGDTTPDEIAALLLDLASLAYRLDKPLTARLMPIPGKAAGETTQFEFGYVVNSKIMNLPAQPLTGPLAGDESLELRPRKTRRGLFE